MRAVTGLDAEHTIGPTGSYWALMVLPLPLSLKEQLTNRMG